MTNSIPALVALVDGEAVTTSIAIADGTEVQHKNVLDLVRSNVADLGEFGRVAFETRPFETAGGVQTREIAVLNEPQSALLITYMRNNDRVRDFKKRLIAAFFELRARLAQQPALQGPELLAAAVLESQRLLEQRDARILQLNEKIAADAPKVGYIDTYVADADLLSFSTVASTCEVTEKRLRELLIAKDWIYVQSETRWSESKGKKVERNRYTEKASKKRYFRRVEVHEAPRFRGEVMHTLKVTPAGAEAIARLVAKEQAA